MHMDASVRSCFSKVMLSHDQFSVRSIFHYFYFLCCPTPARKKLTMQQGGEMQYWSGQEPSVQIVKTNVEFQHEFSMR